jgi:N-acetylglutamate synthase
MPRSPTHRDGAGPTFQIRDLGVADYAAVRALWDEVMPSSLSAADSREGIRCFLERNPGTSTVALHRDTIVGAALAGHDGRRGLIHHLAVAEAFRRRGIATLLVAECLDRLARAGIDKCHVLVFRGHASANAFWLASGALERGELSIYSLATAARG